MRLQTLKPLLAAVALCIAMAACAQTDTAAGATAFSSLSSGLSPGHGGR